MEEMLVDFLRKRTGDQEQLRRDAWNLDRQGLTFVEPQPGDRVDRPEIQRYDIVYDPPIGPRVLQYWRHDGDPGLDFVDIKRAEAFEYDCQRLTFPPVRENWNKFQDPEEVKYFAFYRHSGASLVQMDAVDRNKESGPVKRNLAEREKTGLTTWRVMSHEEDSRDCAEIWDVVDDGRTTPRPTNQLMGMTWVPLVARERDAQALMAIANYYAPTNNKEGKYEFETHRTPAEVDATCGQTGVLQLLSYNSPNAGETSDTRALPRVLKEPPSDTPIRPFGPSTAQMLGGHKETILKDLELTRLRYWGEHKQPAETTFQKIGDRVVNLPVSYPTQFHRKELSPQDTRTQPVTMGYGLKEILSPHGPGLQLLYDQWPVLKYSPLCWNQTRTSIGQECTPPSQVWSLLGLDSFKESREGQDRMWELRCLLETKSDHWFPDQEWSQIALYKGYGYQCLETDILWVALYLRKPGWLPHEACPTNYKRTTSNPSAWGAHYYQRPELPVPYCIDIADFADPVRTVLYAVEALEERRALTRPEYSFDTHVSPVYSTQLVPETTPDGREMTRPARSPTPESRRQPDRVVISESANTRSEATGLRTKGLYEYVSTLTAPECPGGLSLRLCGKAPHLEQIHKLWTQLIQSWAGKDDWEKEVTFGRTQHESISRPGPEDRKEAEEYLQHLKDRASGNTPVFFPDIMPKPDSLQIRIPTSLQMVRLVPHNMSGQRTTSHAPGKEVQGAVVAGSTTVQTMSVTGRISKEEALDTQGEGSAYIPTGGRDREESNREGEQPGPSRGRPIQDPTQRVEEEGTHLLLTLKGNLRGQQHRPVHTALLPYLRTMVEDSWVTGQFQASLARSRPDQEPKEIADWTLRNLPRLGAVCEGGGICARCGMFRQAGLLRRADTASFTGNPPPGVRMDRPWRLCRLCYSPVEGADTAAVQEYVPCVDPDTPVQYRARRTEETETTISSGPPQPTDSDSEERSPSDNSSDNSDPERHRRSRTCSSRRRSQRAEGAANITQYPQHLSTPGTRNLPTTSSKMGQRRGGPPDEDPDDEDPWMQRNLPTPRGERQVGRIGYREDPLRKFSDLNKVMRDVKKELEQLPSLPGDYDKLEPLSEFLYELRDILQNNPTVDGAISAGIEESRVIHAAVEMKLQGIKSSYVWYKLHPLMLNGGWRTNFASVPVLSKHLGRECLKRETVQMAAITYREMSFKLSDTPAIFAVKMIKQHATASMDAEFQRRHPFYGVPADFVNALPPQLKILLKNGLRYAKVRWQSRHLEAAGVTQAVEIQRVLTKVCEELDTQLALQNALRGERKHMVSPKEDNSGNGRRRSFWRPKVNALVMGEENPEEAEVLAKGPGTTPASAQSPGSARVTARPIGPIGPSVPAGSRRFVRFAQRKTDVARSDPRAQTRWSARKLISEGDNRMKHVPGNPVYSGCYNCGDKQHLARDCPAPLKERVYLIEEDPNSLDDYEEACMYAMQGIHPDLEEPFSDTEADGSDSIEDIGSLFVIQYHMDNDDN